ncbi:glutamate--tRNA ligase [Sphingosinicella microcystinivorans]|uniref:glutamate--tRNA ligase n=1 Tax=Sphingosinicella microcystinivorans TaxID=335406 RepID=UPI0022F3BD77|nr:glutamate--tRNA ligase [Sphingosinicella microcystinivorans]WBX82637.1 glutamate--tRNA ligase [Sphingosinicella microcystinivorans]
MTVTTRFAPSPTGYLHVGNVRTALHNWLFARKHGGRFLLRLDDTDTERSRAEYADAIRADLAWLGLVPDAEYRQSDRLARYDEQFGKLVADGRIYPCFETAEELEVRRKIQLSRGLPPVYDRAALKLTADEIAARQAAGERPHWRFRLETGAPVRWHDLIRGESHIDPASLSDPVVRRADGSYLYMLPSVIDDIDMGVTHVIRGEDHVTNSGVQIQMFEALGAKPPAFAHEALITGTEGALSKRLGSAGMAHFREAGIEPVAIAALLARLGTSDSVELVTSLDPLVEHFDFGHFGRSAARFDEADLRQLNARILHHLAYPAVADRLPPGMDAAAWEVLRPNLETVADAADWWRVVEGPVAASSEDADYLALAADTLESLPWEPGVWSALTAALKAATGRKGKELFLPLRRALTARDHGPEMAGLLLLIGRERALARLRAR